MAGFEVIVRPAIFPNIRPAPARALAPEDDPEKNIAVITGSGGALIDLPHTFSGSVSRQLPQTEKVRQYDEERVYQVDGQGRINRDNYVDVERLSRIRLDGGKDGDEAVKVLYEAPPPRENVETMNANLTRRAKE